MCIISKKIKFCSCLTKDPRTLKNYWILHRYNQSKNEMSVGEAMFPEQTSNFEINKNLLLNRLNDADAFDFQTNFHNKDRLELVIKDSLSRPFGSATYAFAYSKGKWMETPFDVFDLMNNYDEIKFGKMAK